jgi:MFS family permease
MMNLFTDPDERARAMGVFGFVASGGGSIGVLLGGVLTSWLDWDRVHGEHQRWAMRSATRLATALGLPARSTTPSR